MPKVRTTMNPLVELDVTDKEARDLDREGILLKSSATTHDALIADAVEQSVAREAPTDVNVAEDAEPEVENLTTVGGNVPEDDEPAGDPEDDDPDDEDDTDLDDTETKE